MCVFFAKFKPMTLCWKEEKSPTADSNVTDYVQNAFDGHLSRLGELFNRAHTEGIENMYKEPLHLTKQFIQTVKSNT